MKVKFVSQPFLTNGSGFIHQKRFLQNQKIHFPAKLCEIRKNVRLKLFISKKSTNFFLPFFGKTHGLILIKKTLLKIKSYGFRPDNARYEKMLTSKIVHLKEICNCDFDHFLIKCTVFVLIVINVIKNQKFNFPDKLCEIRNKCYKEQNYTF